MNDKIELLDSVIEFLEPENQSKIRRSLLKYILDNGLDLIDLHKQMGISYATLIHFVKYKRVIKFGPLARIYKFLVSKRNV